MGGLGRVSAGAVLGCGGAIIVAPMAVRLGLWVGGGTLVLQMAFEIAVAACAIAGGYVARPSTTPWPRTVTGLMVVLPWLFVEVSAHWLGAGTPWDVTAVTLRLVAMGAAGFVVLRLG